MACYAVIDTNVLVSALISKNPSSPTVKVIEAILDGRIIPLYHVDIIAEYATVLHRKKFNLQAETISTFLKIFTQFGLEVFPQATGEILVDQDDLVFYEVAMEKQQDRAYLVTGNQKHYPVRPFIVSPLEMIVILEAE